MNYSFKIDFLGIGVSRAATTWIWECLKEHPEICIPDSKRLPFFKTDKYYSKGIKQYKKYFEKCKKGTKKGQINDSFYLSEKVAKRVKKHFPKVKILISFRNPIEALYSLYFYNKSFGSNKFKNFKEAIKHKNFSKRGFYYKNINNWLKLFPKENFLFLIYEDIEKDPVKFIQLIYKFLEVEADFIPQSAKERINPVPPSNFLIKTYGKLNQFMRKFSFTDTILRVIKGLGIRKKKQKIFQSIGKFNRPSMKRKNRKYLQGLYREDIEKLEKLINRDLSFWK